MSFFKLPIELISQFSFYVIADSPLGPPKDLLSIALSCRFLKHIVTSKQFLAKVCRLKFDVAPIKRRCFIPQDRDLADELIRCCRLIQDIRKADFTSLDSYVDDSLISAYFLMLNNDGKNYAQLEYAGLDAYVNKFVSTRLWAGREMNQGWPLDSNNNAAALWLMWMTLTKQKLLAESLPEREDMILLTLPYVVLPHRYSSALAPPNHFNLPLDDQNPYHQQPLITTLSPSTPYPIYHDKIFSMPYFNARLLISPPLITIAAKLLFVARKELFPLRIPPHLPPGPGAGVVGITQENFRELNRSPSAKLCTVVTWDWENGRPRRVGGDDGNGEEIEEGWEQSRVWDTEWWRRMLCYDYRAPRPKYLPGDVFKFGGMRGNWHGREYLPQGNLFVHFLRHPNVYYPGIPDELRPHLFTEASIGLSMKPVFLDIQEHHKICECPQEDSHSSNSHNDAYPYVPTSFTDPSTTNTTSLPVVSQSQPGRCGVVPIPAPLMFVSVPQQPNQQAQNDNAAENANIQVDVGANDPQPQASDALTLSLPTPEIQIIDYSMSNAWFPGHVGGVSFAKLPTSFAIGDQRREKIICAVDFQTPDVRSVLSRPEESECLALGGMRRQQGGEKMNAFVYETYDPEKTSMHRALGTTSTSTTTATTSGPDECQRCIQREALIRQERKKVEQHSKKMLDRRLRSFGRDDWEDMDMDVGEEMCDEDIDYEGGDDEKMQDVDVTDFNIDLEGIDRLIADATTTATSSSSGSAQSESTESLPIMMTFGDDLPDGEPEGIAPSHISVDTTTIIEKSRRAYDRCRIGVECKGVGDVLLSGETGPRHVGWQRYTMYGRVRPWDGLIGILRSANNPNNTNTPISNIFIFGYIVGENNFVGEWRVAASDPLRPTWGNAFVMSRKVENARGSGQAAQAQEQVPVGLGA